MDFQLLAFSLTPIVGLLAFVATHVLVSRYSALPRPEVIFYGMLAGLGVVLALAWRFVRGPAGSQAVAEQVGTGVLWGLTYLALAYFYVFGFYNLGESARRIRLLIELHGAGERGLTIEELLAAYNARMIVEARLQRLVSGGQVVLRKGRYFVAHPHMLYGAKALVWLKRLYLGAGSEFGYRP